MTEIGKLRELKILKFVIHAEADSKEWVRTCLQMCPSSLEVLEVTTPACYPMDVMAHAPPGLQTFMCNGHFEAFPRWIDPSLSYLTVLSIRLWSVRVQPKHFDKLAELPSLRFLRICTLLQQPEQEKLVIHNSPSAFPCLTDLRISCSLMFLKFQPGAMRKLQILCLRFDLTKTNEHFQTNNFDYGFENLPSLQHVVIKSLGGKNPEAQDAIRKTINDHPNRPSLDFSYA
ncbi:hypothetical protein C2845_PM03G23880 [Panicum miliaceum]|uniref:Disease resistance R13L4/SHOC-2-like LRR domain-containing protein n=1 Tax=Panicum miliaceum TaxID=4540 RepID=A0A3L6TE07_PANMI|nr:hypothetical protein C2845_PM03G23880 [Panicum miliaceum]